MGQIRVEEGLRPTIRLIKKAYKERMFSADEAYAMAYYMAYEMPEEMREEARRSVAKNVAKSVAKNVAKNVALKDERSDKEKRTKKEINKKEEKNCNCNEKKSKKENSFFPSFEEIEEYHKKVGIKNYTAQEFFDYYETFGWTTKEGRAITNWKAMMRKWITNRERYLNEQLKQQDDEKRRQTKGAGAKGGATQEELQQEIIDYLDTHYPVADKGAEAMVAQGMGRGATLGEMAARLGQAPVLRLVTKKLFVTGYELDLKPRMLRPQTLEKVAAGLCHSGWQLTIKQVGDFLLQCEEGAFGDFRGGLKKTSVLVALRKFMQTPQPPKGGE